MISHCNNVGSHCNIWDVYVNTILNTLAILAISNKNNKVSTYINTHIVTHIVQLLPSTVSFGSMDGMDWIQHVSKQFEYALLFYS